MIDVVCGVIQNAEGEYLACRRPVGKHLGGLWEFPGGKVDAGETPSSALIRELREELCVDVEIGAALSPVLWSYDDRTIRLMPFHCHILKGDPQAMEHDEILWCRPEDFGILNWAEADIPVLRELYPAFGERISKLTS